MSGSRGPGQGICLQKRDVQILKALLACRFLSTSQIQKVFFNQNRSTVCRRLNKKLLPLKIVGRFYPEMRFDKIEAIYFLGPAGVQILAEELNTDPANISRPKERKFNPLFLNHTLETNDAWIALEAACGQSNGECQLVTWWTEKKLRRRYQRPGESLRPIADSRFSLKYSDGSQGHFFLEVDRSTERVPVFQQKVERYLEYFKSGQQEEDYGFKLFRVVTVVPDKKRLVDLMRASVEVGANNIFLFGLKEFIRPDRILDPIWLTPRDFFERVKASDGSVQTQVKKDESVKNRYSLL